MIAASLCVVLNGGGLRSAVLMFRGQSFALALDGRM